LPLVPYSTKQKNKLIQSFPLPLIAYELIRYSTQVISTNSAPNQHHEIAAYYGYVQSAPNSMARGLNQNRSYLKRINLQN